MKGDILMAVICFFAGVGIAFINYLISKYVLTKKPDKYSMVTIIRQAVQIAFLFGVYILGKNYNVVYLLIGAALGVTLPMILLTKKLLSLNEKLSEKEDESNG